VLGPHARAELEWAATATANEVGDDAAALAARQRLDALLDTVEDPFMHAACELALAWTAPITGDFDGALRAAAASLQQFRVQDEPFWTAQAVAALGGAETAAGRYDDALRHLREMRDIAGRFGYAWLAAWSRVQMGTLAITQGQLDQARRLLDDALALTIEAHSTNSVTLCLIAFARLAFSGGEPERAALLAGAAEGLRRRLGLRAWPMLRNDEADLIGQIRLTLGPDRFSEMTQAGYGLSRQEAVAAVSRQHGTDLADTRTVSSA